jgi:hypothetical protein
VVFIITAECVASETHAETEDTAEDCNIIIDHDRYLTASKIQIIINCNSVGKNQRKLVQNMRRYISNSHNVSVFHGNSQL